MSAGTRAQPTTAQPEFRAVLKGGREALGISRAGIAAVLGVDPRTVARWERGESPIPDLYRNALELLGDQTVTLTKAIRRRLHAGITIEAAATLPQATGLPVSAVKRAYYRAALHLP